MKKYVHFLVIILMVLVASFTAYKLSYFLGEKYFFDKLFYKKSIKHGYWNNRDLDLFGQRADDIKKLKTSTLLVDESIKVLGISQDTSFKIAVIGDSYVWGQGVKQDNRFPPLLEKKLNKIRNTKVYSLALPGDNILENLYKYRLTKENLHIDLYIFVSSPNDALIQKENRYEKNPKLTNKIVNLCLQKGQKITYDYIQNDPRLYQENMLESWSNPVNNCVAEKSISEFPPNSIFFIPDYYNDDTSFSEYISLLNKKGLYILFSSKSKEFDKYKKFWKDPGKYFRVSKNDGHPGKVAQRMFSDVLLEEITKNPRWGF